MVLCAQHFPPSMFSRCVHPAACPSTLFRTKWYSLTYTHDSLLTHQLADGHLGCLNLLLTVRNVLLWTLVYEFSLVCLPSMVPQWCLWFSRTAPRTTQCLYVSVNFLCSKHVVAQKLFIFFLTLCLLPLKGELRLGVGVPPESTYNSFWHTKDIISILWLVLHFLKTSRPSSAHNLLST